MIYGAREHSANYLNVKQVKINASCIISKSDLFNILNMVNHPKVIFVNPRKARP
jgi:hypothetical protein